MTRRLVPAEAQEDLLPLPRLAEPGVPTVVSPLLVVVVVAVLSPPSPVSPWARQLEEDLKDVMAEVELWTVAVGGDGV